MKCSKCGAELVKSEKTCWQCYTPVAAAAEGQPAPARAVTPSLRRTGSKSTFVALTGLALVLAVGGGYYYYSQYYGSDSSGPRACAEAFCAAMEKGDASATYALLAASNRQKCTEQQWAEFAIMSKKGVNSAITEKPVIKEVTRSGKSARADGTVTTTTTLFWPDGHTSSTSSDAPLVLVMARESDGWRVDWTATEHTAIQSYLDSHGAPGNAAGASPR